MRITSGAIWGFGIFGKLRIIGKTGITKGVITSVPGVLSPWVSRLADGVADARRQGGMAANPAFLALEASSPPSFFPTIISSYSMHIASKKSTTSVPGGNVHVITEIIAGKNVLPSSIPRHFHNTHTAKWLPLWTAALNSKTHPTSSRTMLWSSPTAQTST